MYNTKILSHYVKLVSLGDVEAILYLAYLTFYGKHNVEQDYSISFKFLKIAASVGNDVALNAISYMYLKGLGVPQNFEKGMYYLICSSKKGNSDAQISLSNYYKFIGNDYLSEVYLKESIKNGNPKAKIKFLELKLGKFL